MPNSKNSYPKRAYRRQRRAVYDRRRRRICNDNYDTGYYVKEKANGITYLAQKPNYQGLKKNYKVIGRRKARRAPFNAYGLHANYRKLFDLWWSIY